MLKYWLIAAMATLLLASCGGGGHAVNSLENVRETALPAAPDGQAAEVQLLWDSYLRLRDALIDTDPEKAKQWAAAMMTTVQSFPADSLTEEQQLRWKHQHEKLFAQAGSITATADVEAQRAIFEGLSKTMYQVLTELGMPKGVTIYQQQCPMAFDNRGAWWLSDQSDIANPYFGDKMLTCGLVTESLIFN